MIPVQQLSVLTDGRISVHDTQEWHDLYQPHRNDELKDFFDKYLKGVDNGWDMTPSVLVSFIGYNTVRNSRVSLDLRGCS